MAETRAGPSAVCPLAYCLFNCVIKVSKDVYNGYISLKPETLSTIDCRLLSLSPRIFTVGVLLSPITVTSLLKVTKPTFL
jgi:hypothetical protein